MKGTTRIVFGLIGLGLIAVVLLALILGIWSFLGYARATGAAPGGSTMSVFIQNPQPASKFEQDSLVVFDTQASGPGAVRTMELWVDGKLAAVRSAPTSQGLSPFRSDFTWDATPLGSHEVFVRAVDTSGSASSSPVLQIEVVAPGTVPSEELSGAYVDPGANVPVNQGGGSGGSGGITYQPVQPPEVVLPESTTPAQPWSPTIGGWLGHLFGQPLAPAAPAIPASAIEVCRPRIWISDNSENEEGFYVYRRDPGMADFVKIDTLAKHVGDIFTFDDGNLYGNYQYYVSAFNQSGEAPSNVVSVNVDSVNCKPEIGPAVSISLGTLLSKIPVEKGYCYMSFDGANWSRYPTDPNEFLPPSDDGFGLQGIGDLAALADSGKPVALDLECWGWAGGSPSLIGKWHWDNVLQPGIQHDGLDVETYGGGSGNILQIKPGYQLLLHDTRVPIPVVSLGSGSQGCTDHVGGNFILALVCADIADDLDYAVWTLGECPADLCFKESDVIGYNIYDSLFDGGHTPAHTADSPIQIYFMINGTSCNARDIRVTALVNDGGQIRESFPSNQVHYAGNQNCPYLLGLEQHKNMVILDTITFTAINDDPDLSDDAEGKGYVSVLSDSNQSAPTWTINDLPEFNDDFPENIYLWALVPLCNGSHYPTFCYTEILDDLLNNNYDWLYLSSNEGATIHVEIYDQDDDSADDPICIPADFYFNQASIDSAPDHTLHISMSASHEDGSCSVAIKIQGDY